MSEERPIDEHIPRDPDRDDGIEPEPVETPQETPTPANDPSRQQSYCGNCGNPRTVILERDPCPSCGVRPQDPKCSFCGYVLTGLSVNQNCPECGKPIWNSNAQLPTSGFAITSMVLGIVSVISCMSYGVPSIILGPLALIFCHLGKKQLRNGERAGATRGFCSAGFWTGIVGSTFGLIAIIGIAYLFIASL